jgi:hypothetical protein
MASVGVGLTAQLGAFAVASSFEHRQRAAARGVSLVPTTDAVMAGQTLAMLPFSRMASAMR